jgi:hypothetical protein
MSTGSIADPTISPILSTSTEITPLVNYKEVEIPAMPNMVNYKRGTNRMTLKCPNNGKITTFNIGAGDWIDSIGFECEDGTKFANLGGSGGK